MISPIKSHTSNIIAWREVSKNADNLSSVSVSYWGEDRQFHHKVVYVPTPDWIELKSQVDKKTFDQTLCKILEYCGHDSS